jgi:hypothetical protein
MALIKGYKKEKETKAFKKSFKKTLAKQKEVIIFFAPASRDTQTL